MGRTRSFVGLRALTSGSRAALRAHTLAGLVVLLAGCATYREDLNRGQRLYDEKDYERALAIFRNLEADMDSLNVNDQARYAYLRGMTDYRLGYRAHARHWFAVARATEQEHPGGLAPEWKERLATSLDELNQEVYTGKRPEAVGAAAPEANDGAVDPEAVPPTLEP